jgi:hypothetical protein
MANHSVKPTDAPRIQRRLVVANVIGGCIGVAVGLALYIDQGWPFGVVIAVWAVVATPMSCLWRVRRGRRLRDATRREDGLTGEALTRPAVAVPATCKSGSQWTGAADVPTPLGRINATNPLAVLAVVDSTLTLRLRPALLARLQFGVEPLALRPPEVEAVFPARGRFRAPAIGIRPLHGPPSYFLTAPGRIRWYFGPWSGDRPAILRTIEAAGFPVQWEERAFSRA